VPDKVKQAQNLGMFIYGQVLDEFITDIVKASTATDLFDESLSGRLYNYTPNLGRPTKEPVYKLRMRFSNALDFAKEMDKSDTSLGGMGRIDRTGGSEDDGR